ncbi:autotransporter outer membrane beta-barrel domain-containing protein [Bradyrhizobium forestalis]|nr:autotransporter domain-containing protein [Bradyrhizobium forestalis]
MDAVTGGAGGTSGSPNGQDGGDAVLHSLSGAGGGGGGFNGNGAGAATLTNTSALTGGNGGKGGNAAAADNGGGGGGGAGGYGAIVTGTGASSNTSTITGGNGGAGGDSGAAFSNHGGSGGDGGVGVQFTASGATFTNSGAVTGGNGGTGGTGISANGSNGAGGAGVVGAGLTVINSGTIAGGAFGDGMARANAITFTGGTNVLELQAGSTIAGNVVAFSAADTLRLGGASNASFDVAQIGSSVQYRGFGVFEKGGSSTWTLTGTTTATTAWTVNQGTLAVSSDGNLGAASGGLALGGGTLQFATGFTTSRSVTLNAGGGTFDTNGNNATLGGAISGTGGLTKSGAGTLTLSGTSTYGGTTTVNAGTLRAGAANAFSSASAVTVNAGATLGLNNFGQSIGSLAGAGNVTLGTAALTTGGDNTSTTFSGAISGTGGLTKTGSGTFTPTGTSTYTAATTINGGTLEVDGSIAASTNVTVNSGATLSGTGIVDPATTTIMSGGTLAPGNAANPTGTLTITGNLAFQSGALYLVQVTPSAASSTAVSGTATLTGATVNAVFASGSYVTKQYTILTASGGLGGTTFAGLTNTNLPAGFTDSLSYSGTSVVLNLTATLGATGGLNGNQQSVAGALNSFFNNGGALPPSFAGVFGLTGGNLSNALAQLSGEAATGGQQGAFQFMGQFFGLMLDPFIDGRGGAPGSGGALGFAPEREALPEDVALAYARVMKAPAYKAPPAAFEPRWTAWASGFGGYNRTSGDPAGASTDPTPRAAGVAAGLDYRVSLDAIVGFSLAGGGTKWDLAQGFGSGKSDTFAGGVYGAIRSGAAYVAASFGGGNHWMSTDRFAFGDHLTASFNGASFGGRIEGGYRFATPIAGITPYAALQAQSFRTPTYSETDLTGGGFGLTYTGRTATDTRSELGTRFDQVALVNPDAVLIVRGRLAWAHDWISDPTLAAAFQALPGTSFLVNGATPAKDTALVSAGAELKLAKGISLLGKFDGEFASHAQTYAGTGTMRVSW